MKRTRTTNQRPQSRRDEILVAWCFNAGYGMMLPSLERRSPGIFLCTSHESNRCRVSDKICRGFAARRLRRRYDPALKHRATYIPPLRGLAAPGMDGGLINTKQMILTK
jgi:hypothetical protein